MRHRNIPPTLLARRLAVLLLLGLGVGRDTAAAEPRNPPKAPQKSLPAGSAVPTVRPPILIAAGRHFVEPTGRVVILRGVNLTGDSKVPPFRPGLTETDFARLQGLGMNVVRLLFLWEAYEPQPGCYDESYLAEIRATAEAAWAHGMYVVIDIHQDGFSRFTSRGSGDGFPSWAISRRGRPSRPDNNSPSRRYWPILMATDPTTHQSFKDFFSDAVGVRTRYLMMLSRISLTFAETHGVIGYDLINEPWGDEEHELGPLYQDATAVLRARHPSALMFIEGHVTTNSGLQTKLPRPTFDGVAYAPHYYKPLTLAFNRWYGNPTSAQHAFANMKSKANEWNVPLFLGEFGVGVGTQNAGGYVSHLYDRLDACLASGAQWNYTPRWNEQAKDGWNGEDFSILDPAGMIRPNFRPRPYPRHTAGTPLLFHYQEEDQGGRGLSFAWDHDPARGDTEIFVPNALFARDSAVTCFPADATCWRDEARQLLVCRAARPTTIRVQIKRQ
ncbi:endoglycosylceramidase [Singulisphaera sp. GP187]|nr:endoglycosylceramidase [Singulisphaera sp. GP187]